MAKIQLNKDVTIVWRDSKTYNLKKDVGIIVPNTLLDYIISSPRYSSNIISFEKDPDIFTKIHENIISDTTEKSSETAPTTDEPVITQTYIENEESTVVDAEVISEEKELTEAELGEQKLKEVNVIQQLINSSKKNKKEATLKKQSKTKAPSKRGRPSTKK